MSPEVAEDLGDVKVQVEKAQNELLLRELRQAGVHRGGGNRLVPPFAQQGSETMEYPRFGSSQQYKSSSHQGIPFPLTVRFDAVSQDAWSTCM